ncbi:hypothetical protein CHS0354_017458 [Potamilus streckersoni]|uniref:Complex III assembly factor LYRM7 n=1 Tax=Potamilus streckersoni TaxID=2493646 RepID=A0AAE0RQI6_9BIVA|nr:hypothetical protein CHS0354_017458 [Potamilus streckersoni]
MQWKCQTFIHKTTPKNVLACFRKLHQASQRVFRDDLITAKAARDKINSEFRKHKDITDVARIEELLKVGFEAEQALRETVIQAKLTDHGSYELKITPDTKLEDNFLFKPGSEIPVGRKKTKKCDDPSS